MTETATPTVLRATSSADFLAALPRLVGMDMSESCVVVLFDGSRTLGAARIDLPENLTAQLEGLDPKLDAWLRQVAELALKGDSAAVVVSTAARLTNHPEQSAHGVLTAVLANLLLQAGASLKDALVVGSDGWASFADGVDRPELNWLEDITDSELHDPSFVPLSAEEWRAEHPDQTADDPELANEIADRMTAATKAEKSEKI